MKTPLLTLIFLLTNFLSYSQFNKLTHFQNGDIITKYDTSVCKYDSSYRDGINLYYCKNGYEVKEWRSGAAVDVRNKIWVSKDNKDVWFTSIDGLTHYNRVKDEWYNFGTMGGELPALTVDRVVGDLNGNVWCTYGNYNLGITRVTGNATHTYTKSNSNLGSNTIAAIGVNSLGRLYLSTSSGLYTYEPAADSFKLVSNRFGEVMAFRGDTVYLSFGGSGTLFTSWYSPTGGTGFRNNTVSGLKDKELSDMVVYPKRDTILISTTSQGIICLDKSMFMFTSIKGLPTLRSNTIKNMQLLADDSIWVDYSGGYTKFHKSKFFGYKHRATLNYYSPGADYYVNAQNEIWVLNQVLVLYKDTLIPFTSRVTEGTPFAYESSYKRHNGDIIATSAEKHFVFRNHRWEQFGKGKYTSPTVGHIKEMPNGEIWLVTNYIWAGYPQIFVYNSDYKLLRTYDDTKTGLNTGTINDVEITSAGNLYIATDLGLIEYLISGNSFKLYTSSNSKLSYTSCYDLAVDKNNWVYVINGNLNRFDGTDFIDIIAGFSFVAIDVDKDNNLWGLASMGITSDKYQLNTFKQFSRDGYERAIIDTISDNGKLKEFKVDYDNHPMIVFDDRIYLYKNRNFNLEDFLTKAPDINTMQLYSKGLNYGSRTGIYDISRHFEDTLGEYDDGLFHIIGNVFYDKNSDNVRNKTNEPGLNRRKILIMPDSVILFTNADGNYTYAFESKRKGDTITFIHMDDNLWKAKTASHFIVPGYRNERIFYRNFPCSPAGYDSGIRLSLVLTSMNCSDSSLLIIRYENFGRDKDKGNMDIWIDPLCSGKGFVNHHTSFSYDINGLDARQQNYSIKLPSSAFTDSVLKFRALISSSTFGYKLHDSLEIVLNCNKLNQFKSNTPIGEGKNHVIPIPNTIKYSVLFNNTTKDTIQSIVLLDTLDKNLEWNSFELINSSHSVNTFLNHGIAHFAFQNLNLPPGKQNSPTSTLFVSYSINTKDSLKFNTFIYNRCEIRIDTNTSYFTQKVYNSSGPDSTAGIVSPRNTKNDRIKIYPNPSSGKITIVSHGNPSVGMVRVFETTGTEVGMFSTIGSNTVIDISENPAGVYMLLFYSTDGKLTGAKRVVKY